MITIDITMVIQIINMLILIVVLNAILYRPIRTVLDERDRRLADLEKEIATFNKNAELRLQEFDAKLNEARRQAKERLDGVRGEAQEAMNAKLASVRAEVDAAKSEQLATIKKEMEAARGELRAAVDTFATSMAEKILGRSLA